LVRGPPVDLKEPPSSSLDDDALAGAFFNTARYPLLTIMAWNRAEARVASAVGAILRGGGQGDPTETTRSLGRVGIRRRTHEKHLNNDWEKAIQFDKDKERTPFVGDAEARLKKYGSITEQVEDMFFYPTDETD